MFKEKVVLITGGSSGLGLGLAHALLEREAHVILLARNREKLKQVQSDLLNEFPHRKIDIISADVSDYDALQRILSPVLQTKSSLDMVINNAGVIREGYFHTLSMEDFKTVMGINYFGCLHVAHITFPYLMKSRGRLVNISSVAGLTGVFGYTPYCSSKHALKGLTEALYYEFKPRGVTVHLVCPPEFDSPLVDGLEACRTPENRAHTLMIPKMSLQAVVEETLKGMLKNRFEIIPGRLTRLAVWGMHYFSGITRRVVDFRIGQITN